MLLLLPSVPFTFAGEISIILIMLYLLIANTLLLVIVIVVLFYSSKNKEQVSAVKAELINRFSLMETNTKDEFLRSRTEMAGANQSNRTELNDTIRKSLEDFSVAFDRNVKSFNDLQREKFGELVTRQNELVSQTELKLERIRGAVEEKLEQTLQERLKQSFMAVSTQLTEVQKGLGEMQVLANDVGSLKNVLSNVKMRGGFGEIQLSLLLEQLLSPDQYESNVKVKPGAGEIVEFAIKLPGRMEGSSHVYLPIDAKFPKDVYEHLQNAYDHGATAEIDHAKKTLFNTVRKMAADISDKYIDPPHTTDFAILFLPFEGIFAEVVREASLLEEIQRKFKVIVTGPTTLGAILNSLQLGFKTLAIQKRSSEVWQVLADVKGEFEKFGGMLAKAQNNIQTGLNQLDDVMGVRTRAIQRKLRGVEALNAPTDAPALSLPDDDDE